MFVKFRNYITNEDFYINPNSINQIRLSKKTTHVYVCKTIRQGFYIEIVDSSGEISKVDFLTFKENTWCKKDGRGDYPERYFTLEKIKCDVEGVINNDRSNNKYRNIFINSSIFCFCNSKIYNLLMENKIFTLEDLLRCSEEHLLSIRGFGNVYLKTIKDFLYRHDLELSKD